MLMIVKASQMIFDLISIEMKFKKLNELILEINNFHQNVKCNSVFDALSLYSIKTSCDTFKNIFTKWISLSSNEESLEGF